MFSCFFFQAREVMQNINETNIVIHEQSCEVTALDSEHLATLGGNNRWVKLSCFEFLMI